MVLKRLLSVFIGAAVLLGGVTLFFAHRPAEALSQEYCAFCDPKVLDYQKFYEDDLVLALYTHKPIYPGHCLIIPKRHVMRFEKLSDDETAQMMKVIKKVDRAVVQVFDTSAYLLLQKNGYEVGQTVPHVHFHYVPRRAGEDSSIAFVLKMGIVNMQSPIEPSEMEEMVRKLKQAMESANNP